MPNYTQNLNLEKPLVNENYNIEVFNNNADKLDTAIKEVSSKVDNFEAPVKSVNNKTGAINLVAADIKTVDGKTLEEFKTTTSSQLDTIVPTTRTINGKALSSNITLGMSDISGLGALSSLSTSTKTSLVSAINEVFTNGNNVKSNVVTALTPKISTTVTTSSSWSTIVSAISGISTGKKSAVGSINETSSHVSTVPFIKYGTTSDPAQLNGDVNQAITLTGLGFRPSCVILYWGNYDIVMLYHSTLGPVYLIDDPWIALIKPSGGIFEVSATKCVLPAVRTSTYGRANYMAFE